MTIKEFSEKYDIPYRIAYEAIYRVTPVSTWLRDRDYPEKKLFKAVVEVLSERIERHKKIINEQRQYLNNMRYNDEMSKVQQRQASGD